MQNIPDNLIRDYLDGNLDEPHAAELSQWVQASKDNTRYIASLAILEHGLIKHTKMQSNSDVLVEIQSPDEDVQPRPPIHIDAAALNRKKYLQALYYVLGHTFTLKRVAKLATAAVLLLGTVLAIVVFTGPEETDIPSIAETLQSTAPIDDSPESTPPAQPPVATITATHNAKWSSPQAEGASAPGSQLSVGSPLHPNQRLTLTQGFAEITTSRGAVAILQAPATIELLNNDNAIKLHSGKLVGICETDASKGFLVRTPHMDITDIGTEFGVSVLPTGVEATVFVGEIAVKTPNEPTTVLTHNQTARIVTTGDRSEVIFEDRVAEGFARRMPPDGPVKMARINDERFGAEVLTRGMAEGAKPFTDRRYILKASKGQGIPAELMSGDLIRMPANARPPYGRETEHLQVELDLAEPATVYLLFAASLKDQSLPQWVTRDYEPTPLALTLAPDPLPSGAEKQAPNDFTLDTDQALRVWKRKHVASGQTVVAEQMQAWFTYTLVVVPEQAVEPTKQP